MTVRRVIINADDFGMAEAVNDGVREALGAGTISSVSCMTNMPGWPQAAALLRQRPQIAAGVHLVCNEGRPVLPPDRVAPLVDSGGRFLPDRVLFRRLSSDLERALVAELRAQIERFIADTGNRPTHLDNHCAISYARPAAFRATIRLAAEYGLPIRLPFGDDWWERSRAAAARFRFPALPVRLLGWYFRAHVRRAGVAHPSTFRHEFSTDGQRTAESLISLLGALRPGWTTEILCHPGRGEPWREADLRALLDARVAAALAAPDIELVSFAALGRQAR
ncbi:MAG: ChbG/HpnK family deacetylase [Candidatus Schekmanbacteria bacterium]|nr:ChbG/HpnK family deacetylase [Candidatus Schekmanbacteria bacterium]